MDTIFMNSENSKTSHISKLKLTDKLDLRLDKKVIALVILAFITHGIILKAHTIIMKY